MPTNYVLVDFENVQPDSLAALVDGPFKVKVFVGASQARGRISFELSHSMQLLGANAEYIRIARNGPNAVDMHIAYYIGRLVEREPEAFFHIISRDTDFDPLIEYLRAHRVNSKRSRSLAEIPMPLAPRGEAPTRVAEPKPETTPATRTAAQPRAAVPAPRNTQRRKSPAPRAPAAPPAAKKAAPDNLALILKHLRGLRDKPATRRKLAQTIATFLKQRGGEFTEKGVQQHIDELGRQGLIAESGAKVAYKLD